MFKQCHENMTKHSILLKAKHVNQQHKRELIVVFSWGKKKEYYFPVSQQNFFKQNWLE